MDYIFPLVAILVLNQATYTLANTSNFTLAIGVLIDDNYGGKEALQTLISEYMNRSLRIKFYFSDTLLNKTGGLLQNINYFRTNNANIILDLQRKTDEAETLSEYLNVPVLSMTPQSRPLSDYIVSLYPSITVINSAIVDWLLRYMVTDTLLLYDKRRSRQAMNLHTKSQRQYINMEMMPELDMSDIGMIKHVIRMAWKTQIKTVVLLCNTEDIKTVVKADFHTPDYKPLQGFVGFSLTEPVGEAKERINFEKVLVKNAFKEEIFSNVYYASVIDAIEVMNQVALKLKKTSISGKIDGRLVHNAIRNGNSCGLTGEIKFDANGERKIDNLDFVIVNRNSLNKEWKWNSDPRKSSFPEEKAIRWVGDVVENYLCYETRDEEPMNKSRNNFTILLKRHDPPFVYVNESRPSPGKFQGFTVDIVRELAKRMNFDYQFKVLESGGSKGLVNMLKEKKADIAIGSFTITAAREKDIDFSKPFMDFRMALILRIPEEKESLFNFHKPFSSDIWIMVVVTVFVMTLLLYCVDYFSPLGYRKTAENAGEGEEFNVMNSLWFATASMLQQGGDNSPKAPSGRLLAAAFWFFILIIISTYTANLAAFFTNKKIESSIKSLEDLVQSDIEYGVLKDGQLYDFLSGSKSPLYRKMISHINERDSAANGSRAGIAKARRGGYAYITETPILEHYNNKKPCNTLLVKNLLEVKSYGFGLPKNSENTNDLSVKILKLREEGFIEKRRIYWWDEKSQCIAHKPTSATEILQLHTLGGVFIVMIAGIVISFILLAIEIKFKWIIDLIMRAQENSTAEDEQRRDTGMRVELSQGERTLNPINRADPPRKRWLPSFSFRR